MVVEYQEKIIKGRVYINAGKNGGYVRRYIWIWQHSNGSIPKGFCIHHIDGDKMNDSLDNLTMLSSFEHKSLHSSKAKRSLEWRAMMSNRNSGKNNGMANATGAMNPAAVSVKNIDTGEIFCTVKMAAEKYNCSPQNITHVCHGRRKSSGGHRWRYSDETDIVMATV